LAGHSAGGQFVNRYAAANQVEQRIRTEIGIQIRYVVANPSSYLYFSGKRKVAGTLDRFITPSEAEIQSCRKYDHYKYGLENLNSYLRPVGADSLAAFYRRRNVIYLLGEYDDNPNSSLLDKGCPALLQGAHLLERGLIYYNHLKEEFGFGITNFQKLAIIPNVGHSSENMFASDCGSFYLFGFGECSNVTSLKENQIEMVQDRIEIQQNYPNPFNPETTIQFSLKSSSPLHLTIYDVTGKTVKRFSRGDFWNAGNHTITWDGRDEAGTKIGSGIYYYQINTGREQKTKKMLLIK